MKFANRRWTSVALIVTIFMKGAGLQAAQAATPRLDQAGAHLDKAAALVDASAYSGEPRTARTHRERAARLIRQARQEIAQAKKASASTSDNKPTLKSVPRVNY